MTGAARPRAGILVTGTEVVTGIISDRNGPWLSERLRELGVEVAVIAVVGDRPADLLGELEDMRRAGLDLVVTSGGLGPTADDLTAEVVASFCGRELVLDERLEKLIRQILAPLAERWPDLDRDALWRSNRKQAMVPVGAGVIDPAGTAPGLVVPPADGLRGPTVVVLPGPPRELQAMWPAAVALPELRAAIAGAPELRQEILRLFGIPESEIAATLLAAEEAGLELGGLEITTCMRRAEIEIATTFQPAAAAAYDAFAAFVAERHADTIYSRDGTTVDEQVASLLGSRRVAVGESCTGGLLAARLTERPGSSAYMAGGAVVYSNEAKTALLGVPAELIAAVGAVSVEVALALASGARERFAADYGVGVTGIAGPEGGTAEKPVGTVCFSVVGCDGASLTRRVRLPGGRSDVRDRATTVAMHLLRRVLLGERDPG